MCPSRPTVLLCMTAVIAVAGTLWGQTAWYESFEGPQTSWTDVGGNAQYRILEHQRVQNAAHTGKGCEWVRISADGGSYVNLAHDIGRPFVIDELMPSLWIKSDRAGMQLSARLVLPRTTDPRTGRPVVVFVAGTTYTEAGRWQELRVTDLPRLLARQVRSLYAQLGPNVDGREAYVDAVLLNIYGGPGVTNVWIDDLDVAGYVASSASARTQGANSPAQAGQQPVAGDGWVAKGSATRDSSQDASWSAAVPAAPGGQDARAPGSVQALQALPKRHDIKLSGSVLTIDDRPFFPRAIEYQGEPLPLLKQLGFNVIWLRRLPAPEILEEADRLGLWVICPSPCLPRADARSGAPAVLTNVGPVFDPVLMWDLGDDLGPEQVEPTRLRAELIRSADRRGGRPLICRPESQLREYSRLDNSMIMLVDRRPLGTSMELVDYGLWVRRQPLLARPGTPFWTTVQTQPNEGLRQQIAALEPGNPPPLEISYEQIELAVLTAVASGSRGLLFLSSSPLDAGDTATRQRAMALELMNLELELVEPWAAAGNYVTTASAGARDAKRDITSAVLKTERAQLVLPIWYSPGAQCVPAQSALGNLALVVPGVPESASAFQLNPGGLRTLNHKRVPGGMSVTLGEFALTGRLLLAQDPLVLKGLSQRAANIGPRAAQLQRDLAAHKLSMVQALAPLLERHGAARSPVPEKLGDAGKYLQMCDGQLAARQFAACGASSARALSALRAVERYFWENAINELASPVTSPAAASFGTLPAHWRLIDRIRGSRFGANLLPGGDFENLNLMFQNGWRYLKTSAPGVQSAADLAPGAAHSGALGLRLTLAPDDPKNPPAMLETPPIRFVSPSVPVEAGQIVCIHGWANVPAPITGSVDGLVIYDSLGGEDLEDRIGHTSGWQQFALYRVVPQSGTMSVAFALSGVGEAWLDDVVVQVLDSSPGALTAR